MNDPSASASSHDPIKPDLFLFVSSPRLDRRVEVGLIRLLRNSSRRRAVCTDWYDCTVYCLAHTIHTYTEVWQHARRKHEQRSSVGTCSSMMSNVTSNRGCTLPCNSIGIDARDKHSSYASLCWQCPTIVIINPSGSNSGPGAYLLSLMTRGPGEVSRSQQKPLQIRNCSVTLYVKLQLLQPELSTHHDGHTVS